MLLASVIGNGGDLIIKIVEHAAASFDFSLQKTWNCIQLLLLQASHRMPSWTQIT